MSGSAGTATANAGRQVAGLSALFGALYLIQGFAEPTEGLVAQPVRSLLKEWGYGPAHIGAFAALLALPWWFKPIYGLLSDFVPIAGYRRRSYLIGASALAMISFLGVYLFPVPAGAGWLLLAALLAPTMAVACLDVVIDALMIDRGQPIGLTGRLQSVQWTAMWGATIVAGSLGGYLAEHQRQYSGFLICGLLSVAALAIVLCFVRERPIARAQIGARPRAAASLVEAARSPGVLLAGAFLFLWNFNPFSTAVLYLHMTEQLGLSEQFYGHSVSLMALGALLASGLYGFYCRRVPFGLLLHGSVACGVLATVAYLALRDSRSAAILSLAVGFFHMTGTMVQLDLAARHCPLKSAATVFALLMALSNVSTSLATWLGGLFYERWLETLGPNMAFNWLVVAGSAISGCCWLLAPALARDERRQTIPLPTPQPELVQQAA